VDEIVPEPEGGAHTDHEAAARFLDEVLDRQLVALTNQPSGIWLMPGTRVPQDGAVLRPLELTAARPSLSDSKRGPSLLRLRRTQEDILRRKGRDPSTPDGRSGQTCFVACLVNHNTPHPPCFL